MDVLFEVVVPEGGAFGRTGPRSQGLASTAVSRPAA